MRSFILTIAVVILFQISNAQQTIIQFEINSSIELQAIADIISIDKIDNKTITAYTNPSELEDLKKLGYHYDTLPHPAQGKSYSMAYTIAEMENWDKYPTYDVYIDMMYQFQENYPNLCKIAPIGNSVNGREIIAAKLSSEVGGEGKPQFLFTSTIHGDETTGFVLLLRLIHALLSDYESVTKSNYLLDNFEIFICPNENPDGTYRSDNTTITTATRANANGVDLNRDYPDPRIGNNSPYQPETKAMMDFVNEHNFIASANFHGGIELANYPWDTWTQNSPDYIAHADSEWWQYVAGNYAASCQANSPGGYFTAYGGVTNGGDWYVITGGRQDYMNFYQNCREMTLEISNTKLPPPEELPNYWNYNYEAMINYIAEAGYGFRGTVTNYDEEPLYAKIQIINHDTKNSEVYTNTYGKYYRPIAPGTYDVSYTAQGYQEQTHTITVDDWQTITTQNVILDLPSSIPETDLSTLTVYPNPATNYININNPESEKIESVQIYNKLGQLVFSQNHKVNQISFQLASGLYFMSVRTAEKHMTHKLVIE